MPGVTLNEDGDELIVLPGLKSVDMTRWTILEAESADPNELVHRQERTSCRPIYIFDTSVHIHAYFMMNGHEILKGFKQRIT